MHGWNDPIDRGQDARAGEPADLGFFDLDRGPDEMPARRVRAGSAANPTRTGPNSRRPGHQDQRGEARRRSSGRHRRPGRLRAPIGLGLAVTALLGLLGVVAALIPPALTSAPGTSGASGAEQPTPDGSELSPDGTPTPEVSPTVEPATTPASPSPSPSSVRPSRTPSATPNTTRSRTTSPASRRTTRAPIQTSPSQDSREAQVLEIVNRERAANGCDPVVMNGDLAEAARLHSQDQGEHANMSHTGSDGSDFVERARRAGYGNPIGENVAMGYSTAAAVMDGWMNSSGHRANILNCDAKAMGVGVATGTDGRLYWTQVFGSTA